MKTAQIISRVVTFTLMLVFVSANLTAQNKGRGRGKNEAPSTTQTEISAFEAENLVYLRVVNKPAVITVIAIT